MIIITVLGVLLLPAMVSAQVEAGLISFTAAFREDKSIAANQVVKYSDIFTNHGGAYSKATGFFTVPRNGLYVFNIHALSQSGSEFLIDLYQNDRYVVSAWGRNTFDYASGDNSVVLRLVKGDQVYVKAQRQVDLYGRSSDVYVTFSGFILGLLSIAEVF